MKFSSFLAATTLTVVSGAALAQANHQPQAHTYDQPYEGAYATIWGGANIPAGDWTNADRWLTPVKTGGALGLGLGYHFGQVRVEGEFSYFGNDIKYADEVGVNATLNQLNFMLNGYYDFYTNTQLMPYLGVGIGMTNFSLAVDNDVISFDDGNRFAAQGIAGLEYQYSRNVGFGVEYRLKYASLPGDLSAYNNILAARLNYYF